MVMQSPREYTLPGGIAVRRTQPACGAELAGIDLAEIGEEQAESIRRALFAHGVIFFRGQGHLTFDQHLALAQIFGTPVRDGPDPQRPQITPVRSRAGSREGTASHWHVDGCYQQNATSVSVLRAISPSDFGGDTCFSSSVAAYAGLPDELKAEIDGLRYYTCLADRMPRDNASFGTSDKWNKLREQYPPVTPPVVIVHPVTGARARSTSIPRGPSVSRTARPRTARRCSPACSPKSRAPNTRRAGSGSRARSPSGITAWSIIMVCPTSKATAIWNVSPCTTVRSCRSPTGKRGDKRLRDRAWLSVIVDTI
jgi:hypothetical protein